MSEQAVPSTSPNSPGETLASNAARIRELATEGSTEAVLRVVAEDGDESSFTWAELDRRSDQLAGALLERGVGQGDILGVGLPNSAAFVLSVLASWKIGAIPVPLRWDIPDWERVRLLERVQPKLALGHDDVAWIDATAALAVPELPDAVSPHVNGICSSGSTGLPKVILVNRPSVYDPVVAPPIIENWVQVPMPETILVMGPMYHTNGFATLHRLLGGDRLVIMGRFDATRAVDLVERYRVSTFTATPTMLKRIADVPGINGRDLSSIQWILQGAAPMPPTLLHRWIELIGADKIVMAYGMTEGLGLTALRADEWLTHEGSVGRSIRETDIRIFDEDGSDVPPGEIGDIYMRSPMTGGYRYLGGAPDLPKTEDGFQT
ncbi:MAG TPA: AMP-binding protein, partial [Acidimicrobiales bacterium]|nr:AMP-binding protein [Acidimicrobiales bacterium]